MKTFLEYLLEDGKNDNLWSGTDNPEIINTFDDSVKNEIVNGVKSKINKIVNTLKKKTDNDKEKTRIDKRYNKIRKWASKTKLYTRSDDLIDKITTKLEERGISPQILSIDQEENQLNNNDFQQLCHILDLNIDSNDFIKNDITKSSLAELIDDDNITKSKIFKYLINKTDGKNKNAVIGKGELLFAVLFDKSRFSQSKGDVTVDGQNIEIKCTNGSFGTTGLSEYIRKDFVTNFLFPRGSKPDNIVDVGTKPVITYLNKPENFSFEQLDESEIFQNLIKDRYLSKREQYTTRDIWFSFCSWFLNKYLKNSNEFAHLLLFNANDKHENYDYIYIPIKSLEPENGAHSLEELHNMGVTCYFQTSHGGIRLGVSFKFQ